MLHIQYILVFIQNSNLYTTFLSYCDLLRPLFAVKKSSPTGVLGHSYAGLASFLQWNKYNNNYVTAILTEFLLKVALQILFIHTTPVVEKPPDNKRN